MNYLIPFTSTVFFALGGRDQITWIPFPMKWFRWFFLGASISLITWNILPLATYFISTSCISYGENWLRKLIGKYTQWILYGICFGLASWPILGAMAIIQTLISAIAFPILMYLSNDSPLKLNHRIVEILFPLFGTIMYMF